MFREYEAFKQAVANLNKRSDELQRELNDKRTEREQAMSRYQEMLVEDSSGIKSHSTADISDVKARADRLAIEIGVMEERIELVKKGKPEQLESLLEDVQAGWRREVELIAPQVERVFEEARELRAQLTLKIAEGNQHYARASELRGLLNEAESLAGLGNDRETKQLGIPEHPLTSEYNPAFMKGGVTDKCVLPTARELEEAYRYGELPRWIEYYAETGEVVTNATVNELRSQAETKGDQSRKNLFARLFGGKS
ncbi:hypothetical protein [Cohnella fermenti]|uniref:Uncharacterized protein n=1 Tax=Cohnella fermenti TaxID=2565925 RepID=A0A4S4CCP0_9BACL|nr:hypothetical protein [Cohnella fermenti]THF83722.1 hypothetical protein E6C55_03255 [Cohnella fermenti]